MRLVVVLVAGCWTGSPPPPVQKPTPRVETPAAGSAQLVQRVPGGGVIQLEGDRRAAMKEAVGHMTDHCGDDNFVIVQEGEEAIGSGTVGSDVTITTAWRVHYQCNEPSDVDP